VGDFWNVIVILIYRLHKYSLWVKLVREKDAAENI
jgi:hypothetical protein